MSKKQQQWNCRAGINGWHEIGCPHQTQQSDWGKDWDDVGIRQKIEVIPIPGGVKIDVSKLREAISSLLQQARAKCRAETLKEVEQIMRDTLSADTLEYHREMNKLYLELDNLRKKYAKK